MQYLVDFARSHLAFLIMATTLALFVWHLRKKAWGGPILDFDHFKKIDDKAAADYVIGTFNAQQNVLFPAAFLASALNWLIEILIDNVKPAPGSSLDALGITDGDRLFFYYFLFYTAMWALYFCSKSDLRFFRIRTLRRLLKMTSQQWDRQCSSADIREVYENKANSAVTAIAILITASVLILEFIHGRLTLSEGVDMALVYLLGAGIAAIISFVAFIISVDSLETIFNRFANTELTRTLLFEFYARTINPKYYGLLAMLYAAIFSTAYVNPYFGCFTIATIFYVGHDHWFPRIDLSTAKRWRRRGIGLSLAFLPLALAAGQALH